MFLNRMEAFDLCGVINITEMITCKKFAVGSVISRSIVCVDDYPPGMVPPQHPPGNTELFSIEKGTCTNLEADAMLFYIVELLNEKRNFKNHYEKYGTMIRFGRSLYDANKK